MIFDPPSVRNIFLFGSRSLAVFVIATFASDGIHWLLHQCARARSSWLRRIGDLHRVHHEFYNEELKINGAHTWRNLAIHYPLETFGLVVSCWLLRPWLGRAPVYLNITYFLLAAVKRILQRGMDGNHRPLSRVNVHFGSVLVGRDYHALHHLFPRRFLGSYLSLFDRIFGTAAALDHQRVLVVGKSTPFTRTLVRELEIRRNCSVTFAAEYPADPATSIGSGADILMLITPTPAGVRSWVDGYRVANSGRAYGGEIWMIDDETDFASFGTRTIVRHLSGGKGRADARWALFFMARDVRLLPLSVLGHPKGSYETLNEHALHE